MNFKKNSVVNCGNSILHFIDVEDSSKLFNCVNKN